MLSLGITPHARILLGTRPDVLEVLEFRPAAVEVRFQGGTQSIPRRGFRELSVMGEDGQPYIVRVEYKRRGAQCPYLRFDAPMVVRIWREDAVIKHRR